MFSTLAVTGVAGAVLWGHRTAIVVARWRIVRTKDTGGDWILSAAITRIDKFQSRQAPLLFTAPRPGGFWMWPVDAIEIGDTSLLAYLGPPER